MSCEDYQVITEITHVIRGGRCVSASQPSLPYEITGNVAYLITIGPGTSHYWYYVITWIEAVQKYGTQGSRIRMVNKQLIIGSGDHHIYLYTPT